MAAPARPRLDRLLAGLLVSLLGACGEPGSERPAAPSGPLALRPGDSLMDHLQAVRVSGHPESSVPLPVREAARAALAAREAHVPEDAWRRTEGGQYVVTPPLRADLRLGRPWLRHEGRLLPIAPDLRALPGVGPGDRLWRDGETGVRLHWDSGRGHLTAAGERPPGPVAFGWDAEPDLFVTHAEQRLVAGLPAPADARALSVAVTLAPQRRPALLAPAPTVLSVDLAPLAVDQLAFAIALPDLSFELVDGLLARSRAASDGVTFAVEVVADGETTRVFSRHVTPRDLYQEHTADLSPWRGRAVTLRLLSEPGPAGDPAFDYALWAGLRLYGEPSRAPERPHVVLVDVDTLRADRLGCYGYPRPTTPRLDAWVEQQAVLYEDCLAASNWTLPSTVALLTGLSVSQYPVLAFPQAITEQAEPIAQRLRAAGYETLARTEAGFVGAPFGFGLGFDVYDSPRLPWKDFHAAGWSAELARLRQRRSERPVFVFLHTYMVHEPYFHDARFLDPERPYDGPLRDEATSPAGAAMRAAIDGEPIGERDVAYLSDLYDAAIRRMDDVVGGFLEGLEQAFGDEPYLVIVTSDHGEEFFEHGHLGHGGTLYQELLHVPLLVRHPRGDRTGRVDAPVSALDVVPTILHAAGLPRPEHLSGASLLSEIPPRRLRLAQHADTAHAVTFDGWKALFGEIAGYGTVDPLDRLYHVANDPTEDEDLAAAEPQRMKHLARLLADFLRTHPQLGGGEAGEGEVDASIVDELKALGYLGGDG